MGENHRIHRFHSFHKEKIFHSLMFYILHKDKGHIYQDEGIIRT